MSTPKDQGESKQDMNNELQESITEPTSELDIPEQITRESYHQKMNRLQRERQQREQQQQ